MGMVFKRSSLMASKLKQNDMWKYTHIHKTYNVLLALQNGNIEFVNLLYCQVGLFSSLVVVFTETIHSGIVFPFTSLVNMHPFKGGRQVGGISFYTSPSPHTLCSAYLLFVSMSCLCAASDWSYSI